MDIYAPKGTEVMVTEATAKQGSDNDAILVEKYLEINKPYHVDHTDVHDWYTDVYLEEVPGVAFNSVNFVQVIPTRKEHPLIEAINEGLGLNKLPPHPTTTCISKN